MTDSTHKITALLVDDELYFRRFISQVIRKLGIESMVQAADGFEAVNQFKLFKPDFVILDINMPHKDGLETLRDIRKISDQVPIFMLTSTADEYIVEQCVVDGANFFLRKDVPANELNQQICELVLENFPEIQPPQTP